MKINWKIRFRNPLFIFQLILVILTPVLAYSGLDLSDLTTWDKFGAMLIAIVLNPGLLIVTLISFFNAVVDPTVAGVSDSKQALRYDEPKSEEDDI